MSDDKFDQAVFTIFRLTHEDKLSWIRTAPPRAVEEGSDSVVTVFFEAHFNSRKIALYQTRSRAMIADGAGTRNQMAEAEWVRSYHLALLGDNDQVLFEFPTSSMIRDLLDAVHYKDAKLDQFVDELLKFERASEK